MFASSKNLLIIGKKQYKNFGYDKSWNTDNLKPSLLKTNALFNRFIFLKLDNLKIEDKFYVGKNSKNPIVKVFSKKLNFFNGFRETQPNKSVSLQKQNRKSYQNKLKLYWRLKNVFIKLVKIFNRSPYTDTRLYFTSKF